jgi:hypothetical protein
MLDKYLFPLVFSLLHNLTAHPPLLLNLHLHLPPGPLGTRPRPIPHPSPPTTHLPPPPPLMPSQRGLRTIVHRDTETDDDHQARQDTNARLLERLQKPSVPGMPGRRPQVAEQGRDDVAVEVVQATRTPEDAELGAVETGGGVDCSDERTQKR